ncbi:MAG: 30S ribosomal protein S20 [Planctomycetes bacterium]|nr:30S ribosomal protein S20 [Planctomycetota bacterium]
MPHTSSAKKRMRQNEKRRLVNRAAKKAIKTQMKKLTELLGSGPIDKVKVEFNVLAKKLDKAAARRIVHPNLAARVKSQFARHLNDKAKAPAQA